MALFSKGDKVVFKKATRYVREGAIGIVDEDNSDSPWIILISNEYWINPGRLDTKTFAFESNLKLYHGCIL